MEQLPGIKQIRDWLRGSAHIGGIADTGNGVVAFNYRFPDSGFLKGSVGGYYVKKDFKRICATLMDIDGYKWRQ